jgi:hypothetical protein
VEPGVVVRTAHLLAMGVMLGGAALCALALHRAHPDAGALARRYEWLFWGALGVSVATGVGNLGALGGAPPPSASPWGRALAWKLGLALAGLLLSAVRAFVAYGPLPRPRALLALHALTLLGLLAAVALGEVMAHGA